MKPKPMFWLWVIALAVLIAGILRFAPAEWREHSQGELYLHVIR